MCAQFLPLWVHHNNILCSMNLETVLILESGPPCGFFSTKVAFISNTTVHFVIHNEDCQKSNLIIFHKTFHVYCVGKQYIKIPSIEIKQKVDIKNNQITCILLLSCTNVTKENCYMNMTFRNDFPQSLLSSLKNIFCPQQFAFNFEYTSPRKIEIGIISKKGVAS